MSVKYAVLGLLAQRRGYGYDLVQRFEEQVGPAWQLNAGAIYVALDKLEQEGLVRPLATRDGDAPRDAAAHRARRTARDLRGDAGRASNASRTGWRRGSSMSPLREELHLKLALSQPRNLPRLIELTYEQEQACLERLEQHLGSAVASTSCWPPPSRGPPSRA